MPPGLSERCRHYVFVSTGNVYADHSRPGADEAAALLRRWRGDLMASEEDYGPAKVACEQRVAGGVRPGPSLSRGRG